MPNYTLADGITVKNKIGATSHDELERLESDYIAQRLLELRLGGGPKGTFDAAHLKSLHSHIFQDVFEWAGHTRDERVALSDGTVATEPTMSKAGGTPFLTGPAIPAALDVIAKKLHAADYLRDLPRGEFAKRAADVMVDLNAAHPFREGNGRTQRVFMEQLAHGAGHDLDFTVVSKERMIRASIAANEQGDLQMMRRMFEEISDPARAALLRDSIAGLEKLKFDWNEYYLATLTPGHGVEVMLAGVAGDQFMARTQSEILFGRTADLPEPPPGRGETFMAIATPLPDAVAVERGFSPDVGFALATSEPSRQRAPKSSEQVSALSALLDHEARIEKGEITKPIDGQQQTPGLALDKDDGVSR